MSKKKIIFALLYGVMLGNVSYAGNEKVSSISGGNSSTTEVEMLYAQTATKGTIQKEAEGKNYFLVLHEVNPQTIQFSNRPFRLMKTISTADFVNKWAFGNDSFAIDPPNVAIGYTSDQEQRSVKVVELTSPKYDPKLHQLIYEVEPIGDTKLPEKLEMMQPTLFFE